MTVLSPRIVAPLHGEACLGRSILSEHRFETELDSLSPTSGAYVTTGRDRPRSAPPRRPTQPRHNAYSAHEEVTSCAPSEVDLYAWRQNQEFTNFLFAAELASIPKATRELHVWNANPAASLPPRRAVGAAPSADRLVEYNRRKRLRLKSDADRHRIASRLEATRREDIRELLKCVRFSKNRARCCIDGGEVVTAPQAVVLLALCGVVVQAGGLRRRAKRAVAAASVALLACSMVCEVTPVDRSAGSASDIVKNKLLEAGRFASARRYRFAALTSASLKPHLVPPPHPQALRRKEERENLRRGLRTAKNTGPLFSIGPVTPQPCWKKTQDKKGVKK